MRENEHRHVKLDFHEACQSLPWLNRIRSDCLSASDTFSKMRIDGASRHWFQSLQLAWCRHLKEEKTNLLSWCISRLVMRTKVINLRRSAARSSRGLQSGEWQSEKWELRSRWLRALPSPVQMTNEWFRVDLDGMGERNSWLENFQLETGMREESFPLANFFRSTKLFLVHVFVQIPGNFFHEKQHKNSLLLE